MRREVSAGGGEKFQFCGSLKLKSLKETAWVGG